jgi:hypothetical protein
VNAQFLQSPQGGVASHAPASQQTGGFAESMQRAVHVPPLQWTPSSHARCVVHLIEQLVEAVHVTPLSHVGVLPDRLPVQDTLHVSEAQATPPGQEPDPEHSTSHLPALH